ncbi:hypothetical protein JOM56_015474 [Amanita muscaria]
MGEVLSLTVLQATVQISSNFAWAGVVSCGRSGPIRKDLDKWQLTKRVTKYPSLLEFLGYAFYFPGILVGPYLDYQEYDDLVNEVTFKKLERTDKACRLIPNGRKRVAYRKLIKVLVFLGLFVVLGGSNNYSVMLTPWFASKRLLYVPLIEAFLIASHLLFRYYLHSLTCRLPFTGFLPTACYPFLCTTFIRFITRAQRSAPVKTGSGSFWEIPRMAETSDNLRRGT